MNHLTEMIHTAARLKEQVHKILIDVRLAANNEKNYSIVDFIETQVIEEQTIALKYMSSLVKRIERNPESSTILL
jgi:ferritin